MEKEKSKGTKEEERNGDSERNETKRNELARYDVPVVVDP